MVAFFWTYTGRASLRYAGTVARDQGIRAERRLGEMIQAQKDGPGLATGGQPYQKHPTGTEPEPVDRPTLAQAGISKKLSSRAVAELCGVSEPLVLKIKPEVATVATCGGCKSFTGGRFFHVTSHGPLRSCAGCITPLS